jgi:ribosomal protein S18 acetylase RimI-like enzyme
MELRKFIAKIVGECLTEGMSPNRRFVVDKNNDKFQLFLGDILVAESYFSIEQPDELFSHKYVGLFRLKTNEEYGGKGFGKYLLEQIFNYVKNKLKTDSVLLNVYKNNENALKLYLNSGFEVYKDYNDGDEKPYFTLAKSLC